MLGTGARFAGHALQPLLHEEADGIGLVAAERAALDITEAAIEFERLGLLAAGFELQQMDCLALCDRLQLRQQAAPDTLTARGGIDEHALDLRLSIRSLDQRRATDDAVFPARNEEMDLGLTEAVDIEHV